MRTRRFRLRHDPRVQGRRLQHLPGRPGPGGDRASGHQRGHAQSLSATGGVITSAGLVLAATFAVLATLPLVMLIEVGFLVAFGVLLDALLVRSVLVPALTLLIGRRMWWPSRLSRPVELPDGQRPLVDDEEPALQR
ncbi:MMPL family transporter [Nonomuraea solani]|uniref:MMPL family transporter n=1 Tax=Nonomuraea solani TaxID=1144553 RepID=UPI002E13420E|nr:MMPL family transporter [Nonomuraea solani]